jgi:hypothetical protein
MTAGPSVSRKPARGRADRSERDTPPRAVEVVLYGALLGLAVVGLGSPGQWNMLPAETILEAAFILATALSMSRVDAAARSLLLVAFTYVITKTALMAFGGSGAWLDFVQAHKAYFYLLALAFFVRRRLFEGARLARVMVVVVSAFFIKYAYSQLFQLDPRPGIYDENNFELVLLIGLSYVAFPYAGRTRQLFFVVLTATVLMSGSRSAALGLLIVYVGLYLRSRNPLWPVHVLGLAGVAAVVVNIFRSRGPGGLSAIDRFNFLQVFLREVRDWPLWQFFTGSYPMTPLSRGACADLAFYEQVFSFTDPTVCYSVVLHSYLLRSVFDHGLIGLALLYALVTLGLVRSGASRRDVVVLLGILTVSGLSVSAFNNVFAAITLAIMLGLDRTRSASPGAGPAGHADTTVAHDHPDRRPSTGRADLVLDARHRQ